MPCRIIRAEGPTVAEYQQWQAMGFTGTWEQYLDSKRQSKDLRVFMCGPQMADVQQCACGALAGYLCDYPVGQDRTCDRALCRACAERGHAGEDLHYCPDHRAQWLDWLADRGLDAALLTQMGARVPGFQE